MYIDHYSLSCTEKTYHYNVYSKTEPGEIGESRSKSKNFCTKSFRTKLKKLECFTPIVLFFTLSFQIFKLVCDQKYVCFYIRSPVRVLFYPAMF